MRAGFVFGLAVAALAAPALGDVVDRQPNGFELSRTVHIAAAPDNAPLTMTVVRDGKNIDFTYTPLLKTE